MFGGNGNKVAAFIAVTFIGDIPPNAITTIAQIVLVGITIVHEIIKHKKNRHVNK